LFFDNPLDKITKYNINKLVIWGDVVGIHDVMYVKWNSEEHAINANSLTNYGSHVISIAILDFTSKGLVFPIMYESFNKLSKEDMNWICKEIHFKVEEYEEIKNAIGFLRSSCMKRRSLLLPNSIYYLIDLHLQYMLIDDIINIIELEQMDAFTLESIMILIRNNIYLPCADKQKLLEILKKTAL
jgi:hypothetical protein